MFVEYWIGPATGTAHIYTLGYWLFPWEASGLQLTYCLWLVPGTQGE